MWPILPDKISSDRLIVFRQDSIYICAQPLQTKLIMATMWASTRSCQVEHHQDNRAENSH